MTKEEAAAVLNGREYREEITRAEEAELKAAGLVAVFGASDDLTMFAGAVDDEMGLGEFAFDASGILTSKCEEGDDCPYFRDRIVNARKVETEFDGREGFKVTTEIPHARFVINEDGEQYGEGIVFALADAA